jgi:hypothetical protein
MRVGSERPKAWDRRLTMMFFCVFMGE